MAEEARTAGRRLVSVWSPQRGPQTALLDCKAFEVFFGGARGGGKTDGMLGEWAKHAARYGKDAIGIMLRRSRVELIETIERSKQIYTPLGARFNDTEKVWRFTNGARLRFAYLERDADADTYQGHSYTRVYVEELGNFPSPKPVMKMMATLRSGAGVPVGFRASGNPGGPGHQWVRERYINPAPLGWQRILSEFTDPWSGQVVTRDRVFIPSKLNDNHFLGAEYVANLQMSGSESLVKAWLEGDWSVITGAYFDKWSTEKHVVKPFTVPPHWMRFRSFDWGFARPFSVGWWAISDGSELSDGRQYPTGAMVRYQEWYGCKGPNEGIGLVAEQIAEGIVKRSRNEQYSYSVADPACFSKTNAGGTHGPSVAERMHLKGVTFNRGDNQRILGWDQMRDRLIGIDGRPMIYCFENCIDSVRTIPSLQHDEALPEDLDTDAEDHAGDDWRYGCMSRPWTRPAPASLKPYDFQNQIIANLVGSPTQKHPRGTIRR